MEHLNLQNHQVRLYLTIHIWFINIKISFTKTSISVILAKHQSPLSRIIQSNEILKKNHTTFELPSSRITPHNNVGSGNQQIQFNIFKKGMANIITPFITHWICLYYCFICVLFSYPMICLGSQSIPSYNNGSTCIDPRILENSVTVEKKLWERTIQVSFPEPEEIGVTLVYLILYSFGPYVFN